MVNVLATNVSVLGSPQDIICTVNTVNGVVLSSVIISWMELGTLVSTDSRVSISPTTSIGNNIYTSRLQFAYLLETDEGSYTCNVTILETTALGPISLDNFSGMQVY